MSSENPSVSLERNSSPDFSQRILHTDHEDMGVHTVYTRLTADFLEFSCNCGNDLGTPRPEFGLNGLQPGDRWRICVFHWKKPCDTERAPQVYLQSTHQATLETVDLKNLQKHALDVN